MDLFGIGTYKPTHPSILMAHGRIDEWVVLFKG
jgi:hypothetical protein